MRQNDEVGKIFEWFEYLFLRLRARWRIARRDSRWVFWSAAENSFRFLCDEYGFRQPIRHKYSYASWLEYSKPDVNVLINHEVGSDPWVTLEAPTSPEPGMGREFGLHELEQEMLRAGAYKRSASAPASLREELDEIAGTLRATGADVLNGNFTILFNRRHRHVAAVRKNRDVHGTHDASV